MARKTIIPFVTSGASGFTGQACLDRLDLGYVDMMLLHHPDRNDVKAYKAMEKFVEAGKIRSIGLSNWYVAELTGFLPQVDRKSVV